MKALFAVIGLICTLSSATNEAVELTETDFDEMIKDHPTFVKFYSPSCPHCMKLAPVWEKVAQVAPTYPQSFHVGM
jgi:thiol-disulfide isomerase/thioredoxin